MSLHDPFRRKVVAAFASLPLIACGASREMHDSSPSNSKVLVAYFSRSGNTKAVAGLISKIPAG